MNIQSILQAFHNRVKMLPIIIVLFLSFLVMAFSTSILWKNVLMVTYHNFDLNYENLYAINIRWKKEMANDSLLLDRQKHQIFQELQRRSDVSALTFSPVKLIDGSINKYTRLSTDIGTHLSVPVGEHFAETFGLKLMKGRGFRQDDLLQPLPSIIIFNSLAQQEKITTLSDNTFLTMKQWDSNKRQFIDRKFRVIGIMEDIPFMRRYDNYSSCIFSFSNENKLPNQDNIYLKMSKETTREAVVSLFNNVLKSKGMEDWPNTVQIQSAKEFKSNKVFRLLKEIKIILIIIILLFIYVGATLFGVFYPFVRNRHTEFAVRRSFGCTRLGVYRKVMFEAMIYSLPGLLTGAFLYSNFAFLRGIKHIVPSVLLPVVMILLIVALSVFIPALYISRQTPVEAFHDE